MNFLNICGRGKSAGKGYHNWQLRIQSKEQWLLNYGERTILALTDISSLAHKTHPLFTASPVFMLEKSLPIGTVKIFRLHSPDPKMSAAGSPARALEQKTFQMLEVVIDQIPLFSKPVYVAATHQSFTAATNTI
ncbi:hypothetical protein VNO77_03199 [Canavalia gladiata]|uniref:Uncharacterized protein n=1 Tax=Canavalia gladiata TaxID=3824 RepID=A0AAN9MUF0_CANGL